eukprot:7341449-Pyramimonas_sp.AAC.1
MQIFSIQWGKLAFGHYNLCRNRSPGAVESRSRWRFACNLLMNRALALEFHAIYKRRAPDTQAPRSRAHA